MKCKLPLAALISLTVAVSVVAQASKRRHEVVHKFQACIKPTRPATLDCSEEFVANVIELYDRGDHTVLRPLLDAGLSSDGALAEELGWFYSNALSKNPRTFLAGVRWR